ncbi:SurA N-terminal domain-containing protein, partial [Escherichia sp. R-CC3]
MGSEQVKQAIFATPAFQVDGKFDNSRYNGILNQMGMTADQYAQALRNHLKQSMGFDTNMEGGFLARRRH